MGADMLIAVCRWPHRKDGSDISLGQEIADLAKARVKELPGQLLDELASCFDEGASNDEMRERLLCACVEVFEFGESREIASFDTHDTNDPHRQRWMVTGGMSWGDPPTEVFDSVLILGASGIAEQPFD